MIHPDTKLHEISKEKGRGIIATSFIPKGTLTYVKDPLEIEILSEDPRLRDDRYKDIIETYTYIESNGCRVLSWDLAKYVNHCCQCNTMSTGYGFEIAIRDIEAGEEITDEYGMFNLPFSLELNCSKSPCRDKVSAEDFDQYYRLWDQKVKNALKNLREVEQPLYLYLDRKTLQELNTYLDNGTNYKSVLALKKTD